MKVIDRYLAWEFLRSFLVVIGIVACLMVVADVFEHLGDMMKNNTPWRYAVLFVVSGLPFKLLEVVPMSAMVAVLFTVGIMARNNEILAMLTGGVSIYRVALPLFLVGLFISITAFVVSETISPNAQRLSNALRRTYIDGKLPRYRNRDIVASGVNQSSFAISNYRYDDRGEVMQQVTVWWVDPERWVMRKRMDASAGEFTGIAPNGDTKWDFDRLVETSFDFRGHLDELTLHPADQTFTRQLSPGLNITLRSRQKPEEMNFRELRQYVGLLQIRGVNTTAFETDLYLKIAYPLGAVLLTLMGIACGMRAQKGSLVMGFGIGMVLAVSFFMITATSRALGHGGLQLPAELFAWAPTVLFGLAASFMIWRSGRPV